MADNAYVEEAKALLEYFRQQSEAIQKEATTLQQKLAEKQAKLTALAEDAKKINDGLHVYQQHRGQKPITAPPKDVSPEDVATVQGARSQEHALILLAATRGSREIGPSEGWPVLVAAGIMKPVGRRKCYTNVYTILNRSSHFERSDPGKFRLISEPVAYEAKAGRGPGESTGLVREVIPIRQQHPDWGIAQVTDYLQQQGWDFRGKKPVQAVSGAFRAINGLVKMGRVHLTPVPGPSSVVQFPLASNS